MVEVVSGEKKPGVEDNTSQGSLFRQQVERKVQTGKSAHLMQVKLRRNVRMKDQYTTPSKRDMERKTIDRSQVICNPEHVQIRNETERSDRPIKRTGAGFADGKTSVRKARKC